MFQRTHLHRKSSNQRINRAWLLFLSERSNSHSERSAWFRDTQMTTKTPRLRDTVPERYCVWEIICFRITCYFFNTFYTFFYKLKFFLNNKFFKRLRRKRELTKKTARPAELVLTKGKRFLNFQISKRYLDDEDFPPQRHASKENIKGTLVIFLL